MCIHWGNKFPVPPNTVRVGMPPALHSQRFRYFHASSCMPGICRCPVSNARRAQKFGEEEARRRRTI